MELPKVLVDQVREGNVVLFLGAGAAFDSIHPKGKKPPTGKQLSDLLAEEFLGKEYIGYDLQYVSELAISESDLFRVQKFVADIFKDFGPGEHHNLIPKFMWHQIYTTNYDRIIEKAYENANPALQNLSTFIKNGERVRDKMMDSESLMYTKLHGCITDINDKDTPLILTPDQYVEHKQNRDRLFSRLEETSHEYSIVFAGFSFADWDIRYTLKHLDSLGDARPRSYMVGPSITDAEQRLWDNKKVSSIKMTFKEFMEQLDKEISENDRVLSKAFHGDIDHPVNRRFVSGAQHMSQNLVNYLTHDGIFIHSNLAEKDTSPSEFYKGYFDSFDPIIKNLDVERKIKDDILSEAFLIDEEDRNTLQDFYLIKGNGGSGKSVLLKRIAWDAAISFDKVCIYHDSDLPISYDVINELHQKIKERLFLFIDRPSEQVDEIEFLITRASKDKIPITILCSERSNIWNISCERLNNYLTSDFVLGYLNDKEIAMLLELLEKHKSLGYLSGKSPEERHEALSEKAGRELLVALHEATAGKPYADIVMDEYNSIPNDEAKLLYLTICIFHRLGTYARAGVISRIHGINFSYFKEKLFQPLESVVYTRRNYRINDYVYTSRHQQIAELVFEQVLVDSEGRLNEYLRILSKLDIDYESDFTTFFAMVNGKGLLESFKAPEPIRAIFEVAKENVGELPALMQQEAIFEMTSQNGNQEKASQLLNKAHELEPYNTFISHSKAEFSLRKAIQATKRLLKQKYLKDAREICLEIIGNRKSKNTIHAYHTLLKTHLEDLKDELLRGESGIVDKKIQDLEKVLNKAMQLFPKESFILDAESSFNKLLNNQPKALEALIEAYEANKRSTYLSSRLSNFYVDNGELDKGLKVLNDTLALNQNNQDLNFSYAKLLMKVEPENYTDLKHYFRKSFTRGDKRHESQFQYARCLYLLGETEEAKKYFETLSKIPLDFRIKKSARGVVLEGGKEAIYDGTILKLESSYGFIKKDFTGESFYFHLTHKEKEKARKNSRAKFKLAFNYQGPIATILWVVN